MQQLLVLMTLRPSVRAGVDGWDDEDPRLYVPGKPIGMTPSPRFPRYNTVLEAMADGWHLLAPPVFEAGKDGYPDTWDWWLVRNA